jgi:hypothetical protein
MFVPLSIITGLAFAAKHSLCSPFFLTADYLYGEYERSYRLGGTFVRHYQRMQQDSIVGGATSPVTFIRVLFRVAP